MSKAALNISLHFSRNTLYLQGHLTVETMPIAEEKFSKLEEQFNESLTIDLAKADRIDTACLAWLINVKSRLHRNNITIKVQNASESLKKLSRLSDADKVLAIN